MHPLSLLAALSLIIVVFIINDVIPPAGSALGWLNLWVVSECVCICVGGGPGRVNGQKRKRWKHLNVA